MAEAIVRNRRPCLDVHKVQARRAQRAYARFASGTRALHADFNRLHAVLIARHSGGRRRGLLRRVGRALARTLEADRSGRGPRYRAPIRPADGNDRVVEGGLDVRHAVWDHALLPLLLELFLALRCFCRRLCCGVLLLRFFCQVSVLASTSTSISSLISTSISTSVSTSSRARRFSRIQNAPDGRLLPGRDFLLRGYGALPRTLTRTRIGVRALAVHREIPAMAHPAVALNFDQPPDVHLNLLAEIALDAALGFNRLAEGVNFFLGQVFHLLGVIHVGLRAKRLGARLSDAVDRRQADPDAFLNRKIHSCNTCHAFLNSPANLLSLALLVLRVDANYAHHAAPMDHLAFVTNFLYRCPDFHFPA